MFFFLCFVFVDEIANQIEVNELLRCMQVLLCYAHLAHTTTLFSTYYYIQRACRIFREMLLPANVERQSLCELEVDVVAADILNRREVAGQWCHSCQFSLIVNESVGFGECV